MHFYSPSPSKPWNWQTANGSRIYAQVHHANMCAQMARIGHECTSYVPLYGQSGTIRHGVTWRDLSEADLDAPGAWIIYAPGLPTGFGAKRPDQYRHLIGNPAPRVDALLLRELERSTPRHHRQVACFGDHKLAKETCDKLINVWPLYLDHEQLTISQRYEALLSCEAALCFADCELLVVEAEAAGALPVSSNLISRDRLASVLESLLKVREDGRHRVMSKSRRENHWGREASMLHTIENHLGDRRLTDKIGDATYVYDAHYIYTHLGERQSREKWLKIGQNDVFLDIGAAVGSWTLPAAALGATVYAFDPGNDANMLVRMVELNKFGDRVTLIRKLVADKSHRPVASKDIPWFSLDSRPAPATTTISIDDFVRDQQLGRVDFIKIDTDGGEREVLAGMRDTLARFGPRIVVETHDFLGVSYLEIVALLFDMNYACQVEEKEDGYYHHVYGFPNASTYASMAK
jgi:FkbM family methyltransferase